LEESGQAPATVARIRSAVNRPNLFLDVDESLLGNAVNRAVDDCTGDSTEAADLPGLRLGHHGEHLVSRHQAARCGL
jgi:hypothetical protein